VIVPFISPYNISEQHLTHINAGMFFKDPTDGHLHIFGTDTLGRDLFVRTWSGARVSLLIAFTAVIVNVIVGVIYGGISGFAGGAIDNLMMRFVELINGIPYLIIVILLMMVMEPGVMTMIVAYSAVGWTGMARLVRGQIMSLKEQEYIVASKILGAKLPRLLFKHLLPNAMSVIIVNITLEIPSAIFTEAFLSYIGLGVQIPLASWGTLANEGGRAFQLYPSQMIIPAACISLTMLAFNIMGDGLRDALDPKLRK
jgi:oligopeptide transport system permease protein